MLFQVRSSVYTSRALVVFRWVFNMPHQDPFWSGPLVLYIVRVLVCRTSTNQETGIFCIFTT
jgi:hypothetical protein